MRHPTPSNPTPRASLSVCLFTVSPGYECHTSHTTFSQRPARTALHPANVAEHCFSLRTTCAKMVYNVHTGLQSLLHNRKDDMLEPGRRYLRESSIKAMVKGVYFILQACGFNVDHSSLRNITRMTFDVSLTISMGRLRPAH